MTPDVIASYATIILLFPMAYFMLAAPAFLLVKLDIPIVAQLLRGLFSAYFQMVAIAGALATAALANTGRLPFAIAIGLIAAFAVAARRWFLARMDAQFTARDRGDVEAVRRLRRLHWAGMTANFIQLAAVIGGVPYIM